MVNSHTIAETLALQSSEEIAARINNEYFSDEALPLAFAELKKRGVDRDQISNMKSDYIDTPIVSFKPLVMKLLAGVFVLIAFVVAAMVNSHLKEKLFESTDDRENASLSQVVEEFNSTLPLQIDGNSKVVRITKGEGREIMFYVSILNNIDEDVFKETIEDNLYDKVCKGENIFLKYKIAGKWIFEKDNRIIKTITIPVGDCREKVRPLQYK
jgi:hypothetical protein